MTTDKLRVGILGVGQFGVKRAAAIHASSGSRLVVVADVDQEQARAVAARFHCEAASDCAAVADRHDLDAIVIATPTPLAPGFAMRALRAGHHVLCEKPFGRNAEEILPAVELAERSGLRLQVGYNHRYHPAMLKAMEIFRAGTIGKALFIRCHYGHGGRAGYGQEWRSDPKSAGGGEMLDQGVHALDLFRCFMGDFCEVMAMTATLFWPIQPLDDNAFALLRRSDGAVASLHASWTNWRNVFLFEVFGEKGSLRVSGLGGNYGVEQLCLGVRTALGVRPEETNFEFNGPDDSLLLEWEEFARGIVSGAPAGCSGRDAWATLRLVDAIYASAREKRATSV